VWPFQQPPVVLSFPHCVLAGFHSALLIPERKEHELAETNLEQHALTSFTSTTIYHPVNLTY